MAESGSELGKVSITRRLLSLLGFNEEEVTVQQKESGNLSVTGEKSGKKALVIPDRSSRATITPPKPPDVNPQ